jgi:ParB family chromosome partitioning protein
MINKDKPLPRRGALGKGINSLLGGVEIDQPAPYSDPVSLPSQILAGRGAVLELDPNLIDPNPQQPRRFFHDKDLEELANSIKIDGVIMPLIVTGGEKPGRYTLIAGERRLRASKLIGLSTVPVILKEGVADDLLRLALIENIQRADLNIIEEAQAYQSLISDYGLTQEQCAQKVGKDRSTVTNAIRILNLPKEIQDDIIELRLSMGHGRALLPLEEKKQILRARDIIIKKGLSVRQTEKLCRNIKQGGDPAAAEKATKISSPDLDYIADRLRGHLRTKVKLAGSGSRGKIEISYFSATELERILSVIGNRV